MRRTLFLSGFVLLLSGSNALAPAFAVTGRVAPIDTSISTGTDRPQTVAILEEAPLAPADKPAAPVTPTLPIATPPARPSARPIGAGMASWYGPGFYGNRTANGEVFRPGTLTAAHRTLPFGTKVRVTNLWNGRSTVVRINDRGPFHGSRVIDLAHGAASQLGVVASGVAKVKLEVLQ
ncbi:septal ring lytic transglycosylase RlpA family protein [Vulcanococcus limneticus]|uniref:septal ring lytic transglycosylase RlpA family protein n=1 Tax=Vulcanococcus limneticus TaxID=2170428 RepID=UPI00398BD942